MMKILNKCILSFLVYNLFLDRHRNIYIHRNLSIHQYIGFFHEIEIQILKKHGCLIGETFRLNTRDIYHRVYLKSSL